MEDQISNDNSIHSKLNQYSSPRKPSIFLNSQVEDVQNHHTFVNKTIKEIKEKAIANLSGYTNLTSLSLLNNTSFSNYATSNSKSGSGIISDPYIFEKIFINASIGDILEIRDVTFYFSFDQFVIINGELEITNSKLVNLSHSYIISKSLGIKITQVDSVQILNNYIVAEGGTKAFYGLAISNIELSNNTIIHNIDDQTIVSILGYNSINCLNITISFNKILGFGTSIFTNLFGFSSIHNNYFNTSLPENSFNENLNIRFNNAANFSNNTVEATGFLSSNIIASYSTTDTTTINNNTISGFIDGIKIVLIRNLEMTDNQISNVHTGISFIAISNQVINHNSITNAAEGIKFFNSNTNTINGTKLTNINVGAVFEQSSSNILNNSQINNMSWLLYEFGTSTSNQAINSITSNYHGRGLIINDNSAFSEFALLNATSGDGSISTPYIFDNILMDGGIGIFINTTYSVIFNNITITNITSSSTTALAFKNANNIKINNLTVTNSYKPLDLQLSDNITIDNASFNSLTEGVNINRGNNITINNFSMSDVLRNGITVTSSSHIDISKGNMSFINWSTIRLEYSDNISISNNIIFNVQTGLNLKSVDDAIFSNNLIANIGDVFDIDTLYNAIFVNNSFINNERDSYAYDLVNVNFTENIFKDGLDYAFYMEDGDINVYNNYFMNFTQTPFPISNDDTINWVVDGVGNYWSGLQNNATEFEAAAGEFDLAPIRPQIFDNRSFSIQKSYSEKPIELTLSSSFVVPFNYTNIFYNEELITTVNWNEEFSAQHSYSFDLPNGLVEYNFTLLTIDKYGVESYTEFILISFFDDLAPILSNPSDLVFVKGTTSNYLNWTAIDDFPSTYTVYQNETEIDTGSWSSPLKLNISLDNLIIGTYNYSIVVVDTSGNTIQDVVFITVSNLVLTSETSMITQTQETTLLDKKNDNSTNLTWLWILLIILALPTMFYFSSRYQ